MLYNYQNGDTDLHLDGIAAVANGRRVIQEAEVHFERNSSECSRNFTQTGLGDASRGCHFSSRPRNFVRTILYPPVSIPNVSEAPRAADSVESCWPGRLGT